MMLPSVVIDGCGVWYIELKTASSTDLAYRKSGSMVSRYVVCE